MASAPGRRFAPPLALVILFAAGCGTEPDTQTGPVDVLAPDYDECAERGWYGDGECDLGCLSPDIDCADPECEDACGDVCDALWSGEAEPALPGGCSAAMCQCGEAPIECPDVCEAECLGEAAPDVPDGCPTFEAGECDCAQVLGPVEPEDLRATRRRCGTKSPSGAARQASDRVDAEDSVRELASASRESRPQVISVVFHVIRGSRRQGDVPRSRLVRQIRVMNGAYRRSGYQFRLVRISRTTRNDWFTMDKDSAEERAAKRKLHAGSMATLNVYTARVGGGLLGWATFPEDKEGKQDGIIIKDGTTPGGGERPYHLGDTLVHEGGHWLGLFHTFEPGNEVDGCRGGDGVGDTPAEKEPAFHCVLRDSCPNQSGVDPVNNYMDYTDDSCLNRFSPGQFKKLGRKVRRYRKHEDTRIPDGTCGDSFCTGSESDSTCPADCGCAAVSCSGLAPFGCYCDAECSANGDCCADADTCN